MKKFASMMIAILFVAVCITSCKDDEDTSTVVFDTPALYFTQAGEQAVAKFSATGMASFIISSIPDGWKDYIVLDSKNHTITVTAPPKPTDSSEEFDETGNIILGATSHQGNYQTAVLFVGYVPYCDLTEQRANSYLVTQKNMHYIIDATHGGAFNPASIKIIWQSASNLLKYLYLNDDKISFYTNVNPDDETILYEGNAVIGAYDSEDTLLWSWHIWISDYDPEATALDYGDYQIMSRNLGALANANSTEEERTQSFGLYYQWGRKDPFIYPDTYRAANGNGANMYVASGSSVQMVAVASDDETGTISYATKNPLHFITNTATSQRDWLVSADNTLWSANEKTTYDPCPHGWRVAPAAAFEGLTIENTPTADDWDRYGWTLAKNGVSSLYIAAGRRVYTDGKIQNIHDPQPEATVTSRTIALNAQPWEGLYWTADTQSDRKASALYFWYNKKDPAASGLKNAVGYGRANGMQLRCIKE